MSVLTVGRYGALLAGSAAGRPGEARHVLTDPDGPVRPGGRRWPAVRRPLGLRALTSRADGCLDVELVQGDGALDCWVPPSGARRETAAAARLAELDGDRLGRPGAR